MSLETGCDHGIKGVGQNHGSLWIETPSHPSCWAHLCDLPTSKCCCNCHCIDQSTTLEEWSHHSSFQTLLYLSTNPCRYAATRGDTVKLRAMLQQGFNPDSADYGECCATAVIR
jgi:hypothetical protein